MATKKKVPSQKAPKKAPKKKRAPAPKKRRSPFEPEEQDKTAPIDPNNPPWNPPKGTYEYAGTDVPPDLLGRLENAVRLKGTDPIALSSAASQERANVPYNMQLQARYEQAYKDWWYQGMKAQEPPNPRPYYRVADRRTLHALTQAGIAVPYQEQEVNYNQHTYPNPPKAVNWYALIEPFLKEQGF